jgi:RimJ/RimL family protein N-acetyltransferase
MVDHAISVSVESLLPWMEWAHNEPGPIGAHVDLLRELRAKFDAGQDFACGVFSADESELVGVAGSHTRRGECVREIGYWIRSDCVGQGFATEAAAVLARVAFEVDSVRRVEIRCDPDNLASSRIPWKLGFSREGVLREAARFPDGARDDEVWGLLKREHSASPVRHFTARATGAAADTLLG